MTSKNALEQQKISTESSFANAPLKKKIGFFSAILISIGSIIGAGIFFKAGTILNNSQGSILFSIFCWLISVLAVMLMSLALIEIASARNDNLSMIGWTQTFNNRFVYKACKNFMAYIYLPLTYFYMPLYVVMSVQDGVAAIVGNGTAGFGTSVDWIIMMVILLATSAYFTIACGYSSRLGNIQNWIITLFKFIPLALAIVLGFWSLAENGLVSNVGIGFKPINPSTPNDMYTLSAMSPGFGLFIAIAAIFFAYDGFYVTAGMQSEMKEPKKTPLAIILGLVIVTIIYLLIAIAMSLGAAGGKPAGFKTWLAEKNLTWLYTVFQVLIGLSVLSIVNGYGIWTPRFYNELAKNGELPLSTKFLAKARTEHPTVGILYSLVFSTPVIILYSLIGALGYLNTGNYDTSILGDSLTRMYSFGDLMATWTAVGAFTFIIFIIVGGIKNRKTHNVYVKKSKLLIPSAIGCIIIATPAIFLTYFETIANLFFLFKIPVPTDAIEYNTYLTNVLIPRIMTFVVLCIYAIAIVVPIWIEDKLIIKKFGSLDEGDGYKMEQIAKITNKPIEEVVFHYLKMTKRFKLNEWEQRILNKKQLTEHEIQEIIQHNY